MRERNAYGVHDVLLPFTGFVFGVLLHPVRRGVSGVVLCTSGLILDISGLLLGEGYPACV